MDILICQSCGAILKGAGKTCNACGAFISNFSPTILPAMTGGQAPLVVDVEPDVIGLERVITKRQMTMLLERDGNGNGNGNGHTNGNGNGSPPAAPPEPPPTSLDFGNGSGAQQAPQTPTNPWDQPAANFVPPQPVEPTELTFSASIPQPQPQPQQGQAQGGMFFPDAANAVAATQLPTNSMTNMPAQSLVQTPDQHVNPPYGVSVPTQGQHQTIPPGSNTLPAVAADAPPVQGGAADFFANAPTAPPPVGGEPQAGPAQNSLGHAVASAAVGAAVGAVAGVAAAKTFDFFNQPGTNNPADGAAQNGNAQAAQPAAHAGPPSAPANSGMDFFASPESAPLAVQHPNDSLTNMPSAGKHSFESMLAANSAGAGSQPALQRATTQDGPPGFDFFAASPPKDKPKKIVVADDDDDLYPDDSKLRGKPRAKKSGVSLGDEDDDEEDAKPKIARPRGYTPKQGASSRDAKADKDSDDEDDEHSEKDKPPARRSFSGGGAPSKNNKKNSEDDDEDSSSASPKRKEGFLQQEVNFFGMSMSRQNQVMLIGIFAFVGIVFFNMITTLFGGSNLMSAPGGPPPKPVATSLPNLSGNWKIQFTEGPSTTPHLMAVLARQKGLDIQGQGSDEYGEFLINGTVVPPDRIQFKKKYKGQEDQKPIVYEGIFSLGSEPLYSHGRWTLKHVVGKFLHAQVREDGGGWEANYYVDASTQTAAPAAQLPGTSTAIEMPWDQFNRWFGKLDFSTKLLFAAVGIIGGAAAILVGSLSIFGPSGKMNIWEKQKYIPSQFRAQHNKILKELSRPLKPGGLPLGQRKEWRSWKPWEAKDVSIPPEIRENDPHLLILGAGDKGKTRLMASMISNDIESADRAVIVIDSDGGLTDLITRWVSAHPKGKEMSNRIILLDPTYRSNTLGYNPLEMPDDEDLQSAASSLVYGFKAIYTEPPGAQSQWNQQTANILRNAALLLMVNGKTLTDLPALLNDNDFRDVLLESVEKRKKEKAEYITLLDTWGQYKRLARTDQWINWVEPILNRVGPMLSDSRIRSILTKPIGDIKLKQLIKDRKVLIVKVAKGQLDQNANLLGSLIVTGVKQAALSLANEAAKKQPPVALYLDEFDNFIEKDTIEAITSETDKFKIGFIGCIKTLQHLPEDFRNQLIIAVGTMACFALAKKDGDLLGPQMFRVDGRKIKHQTIQNFFNKVNTSPQFELISDEEKLNIDRVVGQEERTFFCYRVGTVAGVFNLKSHDFNDIPDSQVKKKVVDRMHGIIAEKEKEPKKKEKV